MQFSKTTKEIDGSVLDAILVDNNNDIEAQSFTRFELEDIRQNTLDHQKALENVKESREEEYNYYCGKEGEKNLQAIDDLIVQYDSFLKE